MRDLIASYSDSFGERNEFQFYWCLIYIASDLIGGDTEFLNIGSAPYFAAQLIEVNPMKDARMNLLKTRLQNN